MKTKCSFNFINSDLTEGLLSTLLNLYVLHLSRAYLTLFKTSAFHELKDVTERETFGEMFLMYVSKQKQQLYKQPPYSVAAGHDIQVHFLKVSSVQHV